MTEITAYKPQFFATKQRDILAELLADKRSPNTRRAYEKDLRHFFKHLTGIEPTPEMINEFLQLEATEAIGLALTYKGHLINAGLAEATVNRRLAAIKSLVSYARKLGKCDYTLEDIKGEKIRSYRDTRGIEAHSFGIILSAIDRNDIKGKRDYALLRLLFENALRRGEVCKISCGDLEDNQLIIYGKGKGTQGEWISLSSAVLEALNEWLSASTAAYSTANDRPLFISLDPANKGSRLTGEGIYYIVKCRAEAAGLTKRLSPHRIRHSGITAALEATGGDVRKVQKLSRHAKVETLLIYDDNRKAAQAEVSQLLSNLLD